MSISTNQIKINNNFLFYNALKQTEQISPCDTK